MLKRFLSLLYVAGVLGAHGTGTVWAESSSKSSNQSGSSDIIHLVIQKKMIRIGGQEVTATAVNGTVPGPLLHFHEGEIVTIQVTNDMKETTSIHWHGVIVPTDMDGVPGVSFAGIKPGETFVYRFKVRQSGTYWYHSHSDLQEQSGLYGPIVIEPIKKDPFAFDEDHVVMLSDWTNENPKRVLSHLKKMSSYYNFQQRTLFDFFRDVSQGGWRKTFAERATWGKTRMDPTDIADVTGYTYKYLVNGQTPETNWTALFKPGERIRLRFINAGAMTYFDVRIPGLRMTVVQADGQNVQPVVVDEFRIAPAETYDVIVQPPDERAYSIFAETMDRSGYAAATLAPRDGMRALIPERRQRSLRTMADMGMGSGMGKGDSPSMPGMKMSATQSEKPASPKMAGMEMPEKKAPSTPEIMLPVVPAPSHFGPGNSMIAMQPESRLGEPGDGLGGDGRKVLVYTDLRRLAPEEDQGEASREIELHLTGNMDRQMWSFNGIQYSAAVASIPFRLGERLRMTLVNDTMMDHPIHLHGMWMVLENGTGKFEPRKHTINVMAGEKLSVLVTPDEPGEFAFHCHLLYHMDLGMFRVVSVSSAPVPGQP